MHFASVRGAVQAAIVRQKETAAARLRLFVQKFGSFRYDLDPPIPEAPSPRSSKAKSFTSSNLEEFFSGARKFTITNDRLYADKHEASARKNSRNEDNNLMTTRKDKKSEQQKRIIISKDAKDQGPDRKGGKDAKDQGLEKTGGKECRDGREDRERSDGLGERIVLVMQVARRAQNWLGSAADAADVIARY